MHTKFALLLLMNSEREREMGRERIPCCKKVGLNRGAWLPEEDRRLMAYITKYGHPNWCTLPQQAGLLRCGKSCRLRWINYLRPNIKHGNFTKEEEETIIKLHEMIGNRWSKIASCLPGRTDNGIKNLWNTHLKKRLASKEVNPSTTQHKEAPTSGRLSDQGESKSKEMDSNPESKVKVHEKECSTEKIIIPFEPNLDMWDMVEDEISQPSSETESENINMWDGFSEKSSVSFESNPSKNISEEPLNLSSSNSMYQIPDIIGAPESWNAMDASWSFVSELEAVAEFRSYIDSITLEENSSKEDEGSKWLAYLEKELDL